MGMAASQARLLSITARLTNNENTGQSVSYSKQRLADQTQQITNEYNEALDATKLTVLTGFNGSLANYEDISYNLMTGMRMAENNKQYVVTDTKGRILVTEPIADAYKKSNGNYNQFLAKLGYSQADIAVQVTSSDTDKKAAAEQQIHEAWDKYFASVGINKFMPEHDFGFSFTETYELGKSGQNADDYNIGDGYVGFVRTATYDNGEVQYKQAVDKFDQPVYETITSYDENNKPVYDEQSAKVYDYNQPLFLDQDGNEFTYDKNVDDEGNITYSLSDENYSKRIFDPINYEGTTQESRDLYDYAMAITETYLRVNLDDGTSENGVEFKKEYDLDAFKSSANSENNNAIKYYRNLYDQMQTCGYFTYTDTPAKSIEDKEHYKYSEENKGTNKVAKNPLKDNYTFEAALRDGSLRLKYYSSTDKAFRSTTISEDNCIQEVPDERAIAKAESKYTQDMADLENKDKKFDLELKKLDTEHKALETEYESVKSVVDKNVESSFKIFS